MLPGMHQPLELHGFLDSNYLFDVRLQRVVLNCGSRRCKLLQGNDTETVRVPVSDRDLHFWPWHGHVTSLSLDRKHASAWWGRCESLSAALSLQTLYLQRGKKAAVGNSNAHPSVHHTQVTPRPSLSTSTKTRERPCVQV